MTKKKVIKASEYNYDNIDAKMKVEKLKLKEIDNEVIQRFIKDLGLQIIMGESGQAKFDRKTTNLTPHFVKIIRYLEKLEARYKVTPEVITQKLGEMVHSTNRDERKAGVKLVIDLYKAYDEFYAAVEKRLADGELRTDFGDEGGKLFRDIHGETVKEMCRVEQTDGGDKIIKPAENSGG